jgi:hypothetical protein
MGKNNKKIIRSRILEFLSRDLLMEINELCRNGSLGDNNKKINMLTNMLDKYNVDYSELGPGTNRYVVLIDGYVFKFAVDSDGVDDNLAEFSLSERLQPFVIKVYETNGIISVSEYVTVMSKEEFLNSKDNIRRILSILSESYLIGDMGTITKNYMNWGYRDDGSLVVLDFAYVYSLYGDEMVCNKNLKDGTVCKGYLEYDINFDMLRCPKCFKTYDFIDIRQRIDKTLYQEDINDAKNNSYKVTKPITNIKQLSESDDEIEDDCIINERNVDDMKYREEKMYIDPDEAYEKALEETQVLHEGLRGFCASFKPKEDKTVEKKIVEDTGDTTEPVNIDTEILKSLLPEYGVDDLPIIKDNPNRVSVCSVIEDTNNIKCEATDTEFISNVEKTTNVTITKDDNTIEAIVETTEEEVINPVIDDDPTAILKKTETSSVKVISPGITFTPDDDEIDYNDEYVEDFEE